jgi:aminopeptidase N
MLRRLVGDETFFAGVRQFYAEWKYRKAGTDDLRKVMERASGRDLSAFFQSWIYGTGIPDLRFSSTIAGAEARVRFEQVGDVLPVPVTVSVAYADGQTDELMVPVLERVAEATIPLKGAVRSIRANRDYAAVAEIRDVK